MTLAAPVAARAYNAWRSPTVVASVRERLMSLDIVRGVVMVLMAIDHVRVYSGLPAGGATPGIFFTRWVTHFCAPAFVFLAGTAAYLHGTRLGDRRALAKYLVTRGIVLILLEMTVIRVAWTFNFDFAHYLLAGVIWMLGWCMILLAPMLWLSTRAIGAVGIGIILGQTLLRPLAHATPQALGPLWQLLYFGGPIPLGQGGPTLFVLYNLIPWIGVMAAGYAFGEVMTWPAERRNRFCLRVGGGATVLWLVIGGILVLKGVGDPNKPALLRLFDQSKYRDSQLFLLMTLGPTIALLPLAERARGWLAEVIATFGRVPMFYYLLHIPLIHATALVVDAIRGSAGAGWLIANFPVNPGPQPDGYTWNLPLLYLVFAVVVTLLYFPCRWYARLKAERRSRLLALI